MKTVKGNVVLVDDDNEMREMVHDFLESEGYAVESFPLATEAYDTLSRSATKFGEISNIDLVITDINMPQMDGLEMLARMKKLAADIPVILITAFSSIESAIEATKIGAYDYIVKPFKLTEVEVIISRAVSLRNLKRENVLLKKQIRTKWSYSNIIGKSKSMREVFDLIDRVAKATANVLITGESGTGKELVARAIHEQGKRVNKPYVAVNCTSIPENLLESELFGHVKGSFTGAIANKKGLFEEANGGTIFLDEIGDLDLSLQAKILRAIQERKIKAVGDTKDKDIDVRIITATHKDLKKAITEGCFREDLYYRLSVIPIMLPALRERKDDIPLLANFFLQKYAALNDSTVKGFTNEALQKLISVRWNGNVRELENVIERMVVLSSKEMIDVEDLPEFEAQNVDSFFVQAVSDWPTIHQLEKRYIKLVLEKTGNRKEKASQILGINRRTLYRKEHEYGFVKNMSPADETH